MNTLEIEKPFAAKGGVSKSIEFACHAPTAKTVFVVGTFTDWKPDTMPMKFNLANGNWTGKFPLAPGHYEYKFIVDGEWCCEPGCDHEHRGCPKCVANEMGTMNRLLEVS